MIVFQVYIHWLMKYTWKSRVHKSNMLIVSFSVCRKEAQLWFHTCFLSRKKIVRGFKKKVYLTVYFNLNSLETRKIHNFLDTHLFIFCYPSCSIWLFSPFFKIYFPILRIELLVSVHLLDQANVNLAVNYWIQLWASF